MNFGAERNILDRQCVSRKDVRFLAAQDRSSDFQTDRSDNVSLFTIEIRDQSYMRRTIRIVFDLRNTSGNSRFIALEIDDPVEALVASAAATDSNSAVTVPA